jgi:hypothetical protein
MFQKQSVVLVLCVCFALFVIHANSQVIGQPYRLNDKDVEKIIHRIEQQSDHFRSSLDSALDKSRLNGSYREDDINRFVKDFYSETKKLHDRFDHHKSTAPDVESVLDRAARIDDFMRRNRLSSKAQEDWATLKAILDELSAAYNLSWRWDGYQSEYPASGVTYPTGTAVGVPYRLSDKEVENVLHRIEQQSDHFRSALDSALDKSRLDGTREEDDINRFVKDFYDETKKLRDHFDHHKSTSADVQSVLDRAARIDSFMRRFSGDSSVWRRSSKDNAFREWSRLRGNLDELANVYSWQWRY